MKRRTVIGTGWKLYINSMNEAQQLMVSLRNSAERHPDVETFIFPAAAHLPLASGMLSGSAMGYGFQNICATESGSYTGENSIALLTDLGGSYAEIGHAERRTMYHETDREVNLKVRLCCKHNVNPVVCVGETGDNIDLGQNHAALKSQVIWAFNEMPETFFARTILVYEPVWAIGKSSPAAPDYIEKTHHYLRECVRHEHGDAAAESLRIIYGGSNTPDTCREILTLPNVDGLFVGRSALNPANFEKILTAASLL